MLITVEMLQALNTCSAGIAWFRAQSKREARAVIRACLADDHFDYANWLLSRVLSKAAAVEYACHAAELVLPSFEQVHPMDNRPCLAIAAARSGTTTATAAYAAAAAAAYAADATAYDAAYAADHAAAAAAVYAADPAAAAAAYAADAASAAAYAAAYAADHAAAAADHAAAYAADDAAAAAWRANPKLAENIIEYGIGLL